MGVRAGTIHSEDQEEGIDVEAALALGEAGTRTRSTE